MKTHFKIMLLALLVLSIQNIVAQDTEKDTNKKRRKMQLFRQYKHI